MRRIDKDSKGEFLSIVRSNLINQPNYTPYCGANKSCYLSWPRTTFNGTQFECRCGFKTDFEPSFIELYKKRQEELKAFGETLPEDKKAQFRRTGVQYMSLVEK